MVHTISTLDELKGKFNESKDKLVVLDFFATWCGPCLRIAPVIEGWSGEDDFKDNVVFLKCDVDEAEDVAKEYEIEAMPTFVLFKGGKEVDRVVGASSDSLKAAITKNK
ncbi:unnamed protein product [Adineta steineri]|uniref:Thioredoxin n=1 Tax=Adineta steineri TaxID=433720 RepID=A0A814BSP0_9BILA|nr:unnamed protein product [Adineta steineri]CAF0928452.1 unnamed protein product [Adineta steineri]CAF0930665.1 unnamed protein product [Adineta steineri]CAF3515391.1 unnamed protein product [Adineta steineri]CAF3848763.1 unnamed protein product [Adineta steineri]